MDATKRSQLTTTEKTAPKAPTREIIEPGKLRVIKRNGSVVNFDSSKIEVAITKAFLAIHTSAAAASSSVQQKVKNLSESVYETFFKRMPSGGTIHIEEIQDQVELALMRTEELKVARAYVLYRAERSKLRQEESHDHKIENELEPSERTELIAKEAISMIANRRCPLILGERVQMLKDLQKLIPTSICLIGETDESTRKDVLSGVGGKYKAVLSTKLFDEGISCHRLDTLYLTCPSNNPIKLEQRVGRIIREHPDKQVPMIVDWWLSGGIVARQQTKRLEWYKQRGYYIL